jgi:hypothetical protein
MITMTYGAISCVLRNPDLGDPTNSTNSVAVKKSISGRFFGYKYTPRHYYILWTFNVLTDAQITSLVAFITAVQSNVFSVTDYNGVTFDAQFRMPTIEITREKACTNGVVLEMEKV